MDRQTRALESAGCIHIFSDKLSGKNTDREERTKALDYLRPGDALVVPSLDRLGRSKAIIAGDLITIVADLRRSNVGFRSVKEALDTTIPGGRLVFHVFALSETCSWRAPTRAWSPPRLVASSGSTSDGSSGARMRAQYGATPQTYTIRNMEH
ncbi:recombinase family protein [Nonomuraea dietziae]|uniref:recombinase family protein n=1 Tax=Nonomuraea dietziae TaxID=65515 RepID=UPI00340C3783